MALHVASHGEGLPAARLWTLERLLASVAVCMNLQARWPAEGLVARRADVSVL